MAGDLTPTTEAAPAATTAPRRRREERPLYRRRFALAYLLLAAALGAAAGALVVVMRHDDSSSTSTASSWSSWQPVGERSDYPREIAQYVSKRYKLPSGKTLVSVIATAPEVQNVPIRWITVSGTSDVVSTDHALMYVLCGRGQRCSIAEGKPSIARHRALQRESLELALYTFEYISGVDSVIALLPPPPGSNARSNALFFRKADLGPELDHPLRTTLALPNHPKQAKILPGELRVLKKLTYPRLFDYQFQQAQDGSAVLVLSPIR